MDTFVEAYQRLADQGACDEPWGVEFFRVRREWYLAGQPADVEEFIRRRANIGPVEGSQPPS